MHNLQIRDEVSFLFHTASMCRDSKCGYDGAWQIAPHQCSIPYRDDCLLRLEALKNSLAMIFPDLIEHGEKRAHKAFVNQVDTITKPSYIGRLNNYLGSGLDQLDSLLKLSTVEPASGGLVFSVFAPEDLHRRQRPGYVPCLVSGSFLLHEDELQINAFFRSQSLLEFGLFDLIFLRQIQLRFVEAYNMRLRKKRKIPPGSLNLHFARVLIHRRLLKKNRSFLKRSEVVDKWIDSVERNLVSESY